MVSSQNRGSDDGCEGQGVPELPEEILQNGGLQQDVMRMRNADMLYLQRKSRQERGVQGKDI